MAVFITDGQAAERVNYVDWIKSNGAQYINKVEKKYYHNAGTGAFIAG